MSLLENKLFDWQAPQSPEGGVYPIAREGHSAVVCGFLGGIVMFGGLCEARMNDLYLYSFAEKRWTAVQARGRTPAARSHHSCFLDKHLVFVYGGQGDKGRSLGDLSVLDLDRLEWKRLFVMEAPPARHQAAMSITYDRQLTREVCTPAQPQLQGG